MEKNIYVVTGYIPEDERTAIIDVYQLFRIGRSEFRWYWGNITNGGGIGFSNDNAGYQSSEDALIAIHGFTNLVTKMGKWTFDEMLERYNQIEEQLKVELV